VLGQAARVVVGRLPVARHEVSLSTTPAAESQAVVAAAALLPEVWFGIMMGDDRRTGSLSLGARHFLRERVS
jgi:hypothetical protein